jgi:hypothetical protein
VDWTPETARVLRWLHPDLEERSVRLPLEMAHRYRSARQAAARAERRLGLAVNQMRDRMGSASGAHIIDPATGQQVPVVSRSRYDVEPKTGVDVRGFPVDKLNPKRWAR